MSKIDLDKFICSLIEKGFFTVADVKNAIKDQGLLYKDGQIVPIEEKLDTIKFEKDPNDIEKLTEVTTQDHHPRIYYHLLRDELPLRKEGQYIVIERVQVETLQELRNKFSSLEESKLFLPLLDIEIERLLNLERLHLSRIAGFEVPKEIKFLERH